MKMEKIDPGACDTGANEICVLKPAANSKNTAKNQRRIIPEMPPAESGTTLATWRDRLVSEGYFEAVELVDGELGPIAAIGSPRVCVGFGSAWTAVWICPSRMPWGWSDPFKLFLQARSAGACRYAVALAGRIRVAAEAEHARLERARAAYLREKFPEAGQ